MWRSFFLAKFPCKLFHIYYKQKTCCCFLFFFLQSILLTKCQHVPKNLWQIYSFNQISAYPALKSRTNNNNIYLRINNIWHKKKLWKCLMGKKDTKHKYTGLSNKCIISWFSSTLHINACIFHFDFFFRNQISSTHTHTHHTL